MGKDLEAVSPSIGGAYEAIVETNGSPLPHIPNVAATSHTTPDTAPSFTPEHSVLCAAIADFYQKSKRSVQRVYVALRQQFPTMPEDRLKAGDRYTPFCVRLMDDYWRSKLPINEWSAQALERFPELIQWSAEPASAPECQETIDGTLEDEDSFATSSPIVVTSDYLNDVEAMRQRLAQMQQLQTTLVDGMRTTATELQHNSEQFAIAMQLSDQYEIELARYQGADLAVRVEQVREESYRSTRQRIRTRRAMSTEPGKPQQEAQPATG